MSEFFQTKKKILINITIALCYAIFTFFIVYHHEIWRDEAQVWLLLKYSNLPELFQRLINEGHPPLFYLMIMPFVKLHLPILSMQVICWLFSISGVFLLLQFSPFKWWCNLSIILSGGFLYAFPVIARSYSVLPFLLFLCAILYSKRKEKPVLYSVSLFLISQTHSLMIGFVTILAGFFVLDCIKAKKAGRYEIFALLISFTGIFLTLIRSIQTVGNNYFIQPFIKDLSSAFIQTTGVTYDILVTAISSSFHKGYLIVILLYFIIFCIFFVQLFSISKKAFLIAFSSIACQIWIYADYYTAVLFLNRVFSSFLILIFAYWIAIENTPQKNRSISKSAVTFALIFLFTIPNGINSCIQEYKFAYSGAKSSADYIKKNIPQNSVILSDTLPMTESVSVLLPDDYSIIDVINDKPISFVIWHDNIRYRFNEEEWNKYINSHNFGNKRIFIIQSQEQSVPLKNGEIKHISPKSIIQYDNFIIQEYIKNERE